MEKVHLAPPPLATLKPETPRYWPKEKKNIQSTCAHNAFLQATDSETC